jgi:hypothetical protein
MSLKILGHVPLTLQQSWIILSRPRKKGENLSPLRPGRSLREESGASKSGAGTVGLFARGAQSRCPVINEVRLKGGFGLLAHLKLKPGGLATPYFASKIYKQSMESLILAQNER